MWKSGADSRTPTRWRTRALCRVAAALVVGTAITASGDTVTVRHVEGVVHGFLALRTTSGNTIADGDLLQTVRGSTVTSRLLFKFKDGSVHDETAVFTQSGRFRLLSNHLKQQGPSFPHPLEMRIDMRKRLVTVAAEDDGKTKTYSENLGPDVDVVNGLLLTIVKNLRRGVGTMKFAYVAATPRPEVVGLVVSPAGTGRVEIGSRRREAVEYVVKVDIGGLKGALASLFGKEPPDSHVWVLTDEVPAFIRSEQPLYAGGPVWRIELVSPRYER